ncbi:MAG: hypothetical protein KDK39_18960 [Leptospiraceae bacterium]|nr:hypothetical protein [Leptospiraceae bacterium]
MRNFNLIPLFFPGQTSAAQAIKSPDRCLFASFALALFLWLPAGLAAEIPPRYYQQAQDSAPEYLEIEVLDVSKDWYFWRSAREITLQARVLAVHRSASGLKADQLITIRYLHKPLPDNTVGPSPIPILTVGTRTPAWLKKSGVTMTEGIILTSAARGYTFRPALR